MRHLLISNRTVSEITVFTRWFPEMFKIFSIDGNVIEVVRAVSCHEISHFTFLTVDVALQTIFRISRLVFKKFR